MEIILLQLQGTSGEGERCVRYETFDGGPIHVLITEFNDGHGIHADWVDIDGVDDVLGQGKRTDLISERNVEVDGR